MRKELEAAVKSLKAEHETNRSAYRKAMKLTDEAYAQMRSACDVASKSANELAKAEAALAAYDKVERNVRRIEGAGKLVAGGAASAGAAGREVSGTN